MPELTCPFHDCAAVTSHEEVEVAVALFNAHVGTHTAGTQQRPAGKTNKIETPRLKSGIGPDEFNFWVERWRNYK